MEKINFGGKSMKKKNGVFLGLLIAALLLLTMACPTPVDGGNGGGGTPPTAVTFESAVQTGGTSGTASTTGLTLTFSVDPTTLTADDITLTGATKGALTGTGTTRTLAISDITVANGETVSVAIASPSGFTISGSPKTAVVYKVYNLRDAGPAGGLIFYDKGSYSDGWRYLEVAPVSTEWKNKVWGDYSTEIGGNAALTGIGDGQAATDAIVAHMEGESITGTAAQLCDALSYGGYDDWFLPSKDELDAIWDNLVDDGTGSNNGVGGFASEDYWSSSEYNSDIAWSQNFFLFGNQNYYYKDSYLRVRAVRAF